MKIQIKNEYSNLRTVIMAKVDGFSIKHPVNSTQEYYYKTNPPQLQKMIKQQNAFVEVIENFGVEILWANIIQDSPCQVNTRDVAFAIDDSVYISSMKENIRKNEFIGIQPIMESVRKKVTLCGGSVEGGDVVIDGKKVFVGISQRTNDEGVQNLRDYLPKGCEVVPIYLKPNYLHLDTVFNIVSKNIALCCKNAVTDESCRELSSKYRILDVSLSEQNTLATNVLSITPADIVADVRNSKTNKLLNKEGFNIHELDFSEISKIGGSFRCSTCPLYRSG